MTSHDPPPPDEPRSAAFALASGCVVWVTGLPASGKTTLAARARARLAARGCEAILLDSDEVRAALVPPPGYDEEGRAAFYATLARFAALLATQGHVVLVAATAHRRVFREDARTLAPRFVEVYLDTPPEECRRRDPKGLYAGAARGDPRVDAGTLPGAGAVYEAPLAPEITAHGGDDDAALEAICARALRHHHPLH